MFAMKTNSGTDSSVSTPSSHNRMRETSVRVNPITRSVANSRVRCATTIAKVFAIMKAPTTRAVAARASSMPSRKRSCSCAAAALAAAASRVVTTSTSAPSSRVSRSCSSSNVTRSATTWTSVHPAGVSKSCCAVEAASIETVVFGMPSAPPNPTVPTTWKGCSPSGIEMSTTSPTAMPAPAAVAWSTTISPSLTGARPATSSKGL